MASPGLQQSALQLLGRERECAVIDRVLAEAGNGAGGALVLILKNSRSRTLYDNQSSQECLAENTRNLFRPLLFRALPMA